MKRERSPASTCSRGPRGTLYIGVTSDLTARLWQHCEEALPGFTKRHTIKRLVWFEMHGDMEAAILREKQLKNWHRPWKLNLIEASNLQWVDLAIGLGFAAIAPRVRRDGH
jgi:putative endonuclease